MDAILTLEHVVKRFSGLTAVDDLSVAVKRGTVHALVGPNGSGKSTTINMINGMLPVTGGEISFGGRRITNMKTYQIARLGIGRTFQNIKVFSTLTLLENIMVGGHQNRKRSGTLMRYLINVPGARGEEAEIREKAEQIAVFLGVQDLIHMQVSNLPYGMQKMTELGRTMMTDPSLILLDEPAAGLNPSERSELVEILNKLRDSGKTLFLVEHNMDIVMNISDLITVISFGAKIAEGGAAAIQSNPDVIKAYLGNKYVMD